MRKYYVPGMITLLFLPLLGYFYIQRTIATRDYRGVDIYLEEIGWNPCGDMPYELFEGVVFETITFTGDPTVDQVLLLQAEDKIEKISLNTEEKQGLVFTFGTVPYATYIDVLNLLVKHRKQVVMYADSIKFSNDEKTINPQLTREELMEMYAAFELDNGEIEVEKEVDKVATVLDRMGNYTYAIGGLFVLLASCCFYSTYSNLSGWKIKK